MDLQRKSAAALVVAPLYATAAHAQETGGSIGTDTLVPSLMFFTIGAALIVAVVSLLVFLRKRRNREIAAEALNPTTKS